MSKYVMIHFHYMDVEHERTRSFNLYQRVDREHMMKFVGWLESRKLEALVTPSAEHPGPEMFQEVTTVN